MHRVLQTKNRRLAGSGGLVSLACMSAAVLSACAHNEPASGVDMGAMRSLEPVTTQRILLVQHHDDGSTTTVDAGEHLMSDSARFVAEDAAIAGFAMSADGNLTGVTLRGIDPALQLQPGTYRVDRVRVNEMGIVTAIITGAEDTQSCRADFTVSGSPSVATSYCINLSCANTCVLHKNVIDLHTIEYYCSCPATP